MNQAKHKWRRHSTPSGIFIHWFNSVIKLRISNFDILSKTWDYLRFVSKSTIDNEKAVWLSVHTLIFAGLFLKCSSPVGMTLNTLTESSYGEVRSLELVVTLDSIRWWSFFSSGDYHRVIITPVSIFTQSGCTCSHLNLRSICFEN